MLLLLCWHLDFIGYFVQFQLRWKRGIDGTRQIDTLGTTTAGADYVV